MELSRLGFGYKIAAGLMLESAGKHSVILKNVGMNRWGVGGGLVLGRKRGWGVWRRRGFVVRGDECLMGGRGF